MYILRPASIVLCTAKAATSTKGLCPTSDVAVIRPTLTARLATMKRPCFYGIIKTDLYPVKERIPHLDLCVKPLQEAEEHILINLTASQRRSIPSKPTPRPSPRSSLGNNHGELQTLNFPPRHRRCHQRFWGERLALLGGCFLFDMIDHSSLAGREFLLIRVAILLGSVVFDCGDGFGREANGAGDCDAEWTTRHVEVWR